MIRKRKAKPVTVERITRCMVRLAWIIQTHPNGHKAICIYERLERDLEEHRKREDTLSRIGRLADLYDPETGDIKAQEPPQIPHSSAVAG